MCVCVCVNNIYKMENYSDIKKKKILPFVAWMNLKGIMLSIINQTEDNYAVANF